MSDPFAICQVPGQLGGTMPPKQPFSAERAQEFGDLAVVKATESFGEEGLPAATLLKCAYGGIATPDDGVDHDGEITAKTTLMYIWNVIGMGFEETHEKTVRADHAAKRGVPFPEAWRTALKCLQMSRLVGSTLEAAREESDAAEVHCQFLGAPKMTPQADTEETKPGAIAMMNTSGTSMAYILCALVRGSKWLCHRGTFGDHGKLDERNPFDERSLVHA